MSYHNTNTNTNNNNNDTQYSTQKQSRNRRRGLVSNTITTSATSTTTTKNKTAATVVQCCTIQTTTKIIIKTTFIITFLLITVNILLISNLNNNNIGIKNSSSGNGGNSSSSNTQNYDTIGNRYHHDVLSMLEVFHNHYYRSKTQHQKQQQRKDQQQQQRQQQQVGQPIQIIQPQQVQREQQKQLVDSIADDNSILLPQWIKEYFVWHSNIIKQLSIHNYQQYKYILVRCIQGDKKCSGTADRLKSIPILLRLAYESNRILFIAWKNRPCSLEEFLIPTIQFNWTLPHWLEIPLNISATEPLFWLDDRYLPSKNKKNNNNNNNNITMTTTNQRRRQKQQKQQENESNLTKFAQIPDFIIRIKNIRGSEEYYNEQRKSYNNNNNNNEPTYEEVYKTIWYNVFQPSQPVQQLIDKTMKELNIVSGQYIAIHIRSYYTSISSTQQIQREIQHAISCAQYSIKKTYKQQKQKAKNTNTTLSLSSSSSSSVLSWPIFIASDSINTTKMAFEYYSYSQNNYNTSFKNRLITIPNYENQPPIHLDRGTDFISKITKKSKNTTSATNWWDEYLASDFYSIFVDLYMLANAQCVIYGSGSYGKWASMFSTNPNCSIYYKKATMC